MQGLICPNCRNILRLRGPLAQQQDNSIPLRCFHCNLGLIITNPSYLDPDWLSNYKKLVREAKIGEYNASLPPTQAIPS